MVSPDGTSNTDPPRNRGRSVALGIAAVALVLGALALGALTAPAPQEVAVETTSTTSPVDQPIDVENFTVAEIARGEPLEWDRVESVATGFPVARVEHEGWLYLFATDASTRPHPFGSFGDGGLVAWRSENGSEWESLGAVIDQSHPISVVDSTSRGLVAAGKTEDGFTVWTSDDAIEWAPETIEVDGLSENTDIVPTAVGGDDQTMVVAGRVDIDVQPLLQAVLTGSFGHAVSPANYQWWPEFDGGGIIFVVQGPLGFPLTEVQAGALGLTEEEQETLRRRWRGADTGIGIWASTEGVAGWTHSAIEDGTSLTEIVETPTGGLIAAGSAGARSQTWTSSNGISWEKADSALIPRTIEEWDSLMVGPRPFQPLIVTSTDGLDWEGIGLDDYFPGPIQWHTREIAAGPGGLAAVIEGFNSSAPDPFQDAEPITLQDGGATLTIDYSSSAYSLQSGDTTYDWSMGVDSRPDAIHVDPTAEVIRFVDPDTADVLARFTFSELFEAQTRFWAETYFSQQAHALVFSPDGDDWTIQDVTTSLGKEIHVFGLEITDSHVVAVTARLFGPFSPLGPPGFEIWTAPIP